jgi:hypothetical protein
VRDRWRASANVKFSEADWSFAKKVANDSFVQPQSFGNPKSNDCSQSYRDDERTRPTGQMALVANLSMATKAPPATSRGAAR